MYKSSDIYMQISCRYYVDKMYISRLISHSSGFSVHLVGLAFCSFVWRIAGRVGLEIKSHVHSSTKPVKPVNSGFHVTCAKDIILYAYAFVPVVLLYNVEC